MSSRYFLPSSVRGALQLCGPAEVLAIESRLENLAELAARPDRLASLRAAAVQRDGRYVSAIGELEVEFTVDPMNPVLFVRALRRVNRLHR